MKHSKAKILEMLTAIVDSENVTLYKDRSDRYYVDGVAVLKRIPASTLEQAIENYHAEMFGFTEIEQKRKVG